MAQKMTIKGSIYLTVVMLAVAILTGNILLGLAVLFVGYTIMTS